MDYAECEWWFYGEWTPEDDNSLWKSHFGWKIKKEMSNQWVLEMSKIEMLFQEGERVTTWRIQKVDR